MELQINPVVSDVTGDFTKIVNDGEGFVLQNLSDFDIYIIASENMPTSVGSAIILGSKEKIDDSKISGNIWCKSSCKIVPVLSLHKNNNTDLSKSISVEIVKPTKELYLNGSALTAVLEGKDFAVMEQFAGGQQAIALSASPLNTNTDSSITFNEQFKPSFMNEYAISLSQRTKVITSYMEIVDTDIYDETFQEFNIASMSQANTTLTVTLDNPFDGSLGYWVDIWGLEDSRFNYCNLCVASISADKKTLTFTTADDATLVSLTGTPANIVGGKLKCQKLGANNFARIRFSTVVTTKASFQSRFNKGLFKTSGTLTGLQYGITNTTNATYLGATGQVELKPQTRYKISLNEDTLRFMDSLIDTPAYDNPRASITEVKPSFFKNYRNRMRMVSPISTPTPIAKIVSAVKTGTTTATITTDVPHGLSLVSFVNIVGVRDSTNFSTVTGFPTSIISPTQFTIVISVGAVTANSYGGLVQEVHGQSSISGLFSTTIQSIARDQTSEILEVVGASNWSGLNVGEYVDLYGCLNSDGNSLEVDGVYRVNNVFTTALRLEPVKNLDGSYVVNGEGNQVTPSFNSSFAPTNCGGSVILRTTMRMHDITSVSYNKQMVQMEGQGISDISLAMPVMFPATPLVTIGNVFSTYSGTGGVEVRPSNGVFDDIAVAAITSTVTGSAAPITQGNGFQVTIPVTALSGTNPTLDVRIEESFDGGINWVTLYDFQRITAIGSYNSPMLRATGSHIRYVRTVTGTSPSFTMKASRNIRPMVPAEPQKRLIDRSIVLTTLDSVTPTLFQGAANNVQLVVNVGAITTTAPAIQLEGSEDGVSWYLMGVPLTAVANKTVQLTVNSLSATFTRARVSTAGVGVTAGYVAIKAWS